MSGLSLSRLYTDGATSTRKRGLHAVHAPSTRGDQLDHPLLQHGLQDLPYSIAKYSTVALRMRFPPNPT